jgi:hypothetical protein
MRHIHCQTIVKWANGAQIERLHSDGQWRMEINPTWSTDQKYRVSATSQDLRTIIFCVPFLHIDSSNGILSVTRLAETLGTLGVNVVFMCVLSEYPKEELIFTNTLQNRMTKTDFSNLSASIQTKSKQLGITCVTDHQPYINQGAAVLYTERIINNPLNAQKVIRYFGNKNGVLNGGKCVALGHDDFILAHSRVLHPDPHHCLFFGEINREFKHIELKRFKDRKMSLTYIGKGYLYGEVGGIEQTIHVTRESPSTKRELAYLLGNSRFLFTWDSWTNLIAEGIFCGAAPVILRSQPFTLDEINNVESGPTPFIDSSSIRYDEAGKEYEFKNPGDYESFIKARESFISRQLQLERYYPFSVQEFLTKLQIHFTK